MASPERAGRHRRRELGIYDDRFLPALARLAEAIHRGGAKASIQFGHGGGHTRRDICGEVRRRLAVVRLLVLSRRDVIGGQGPKSDPKRTIGELPVSQCAGV
jgi:2,4-dienoyl-CoA reductase-like NADH-dependent reductase (Old Yellow Enzyme family)